MLKEMVEQAEGELRPLLALVQSDDAGPAGLR